MYVCVTLSKFEILPKVYTALPAENEELKEEFREEARAQFLHSVNFVGEHSHMFLGIFDLPSLIRYFTT